MPVEGFSRLNRSSRGWPEGAEGKLALATIAGKDFRTTVPIERLGIPSIKVSDGLNGARGGGAFRRNFGGGLSG